jgi:chromosome segregation ATPase
VEWYTDLARDVLRHRTHEVSVWQDPELSGVEKRRHDEGWNEAWANQYRRRDDPPYGEVVSFLLESARQQSVRRQEEEGRRERELKQAQALARANRRQSIILALLLVGVGIIAVVSLRLAFVQQQLATAAKNEQEASRRYASDLSSATRNFEGRLNQLNGLLEQQSVALRAANTSTATSGDRARVDQLTKEIAAAQQQAQKSQEELTKLRNVQPTGTSDTGRSAAQLDSLQKQLAQTTSDRDKLQAQVSTLQKASSQAVDNRVQDLQRQLEEERTRSTEANATVTQLRAELAVARRTATSTTAASAQQVTKAFSDGVRAYDLGDWQSAVQSLNNAIRMQADLKEPLKEVRMSGTRFVPYAPQSYLTAALLELKADCASVQAALRQAEAEPPAPDVKARVQAARTRCGGQ